MKEPRKKCVRFHDRVTVTVIANALHLVSWQRKNIWFTHDEIDQQRRRAYRLTAEFNFYSDEELFDRYGVCSKKSLEERLEQVEKTCFYVEKLEGEGRLFRSSSARLLDRQNSIRSADIIFLLYCQETRKADAMARDRALRLE